MTTLKMLLSIPNPVVNTAPPELFLFEHERGLIFADTLEPVGTMLLPQARKLAMKRANYRRNNGK